MVSEVSFPRFWGVLCIAKCFRFFVSVIGSAVSEISRFARFFVKYETTFQKWFFGHCYVQNVRFLKIPNGPILKFLLVTGGVMVLSEELSDLPVLLIFVGVAAGP